MTESRIEARIRELGYELPVAPAPVAAYVPAVTSGSYVYTSGQLPIRDGELLADGTWSGTGVLGPEALPPKPFLDLLAAPTPEGYGSPWGMEERA